MFKRAKLDRTAAAASTKVIGTHSGTFQADEAMGCWMLRQLPEYRNSQIVRSRDLEVLDKLDIVIDVGGIYDPAQLRYDHHQRGYEERFEIPRASSSSSGNDDDAKDPRCTKLSASGLVYRHYGKQVIQQYYPNLTEDYLNLAYVKLYDSLLEALDAIDTGVEIMPEGVTPVYKDSTGLASRVGRLNPRWNEIDSTTEKKPSLDERFQVAVDVCGSDFLSVLTVIVESEIPARDYVERALLQRMETCSSGQIINLGEGGLPWKNHLYELERIHKVDPLIKFVLYTGHFGHVARAGRDGGRQWFHQPTRSARGLARRPRPGLGERLQDSRGAFRARRGLYRWSQHARGGLANGARGLACHGVVRTVSSTVGVYYL